MANSIKYSEGSESLALNKGNWWIGTGDSNKGPTVESGYWNTINPPSGGYTVYLNKETNGPSIHSISNDENLISFTNKISGNNYTTVAECLVYYQTQDDKLCVNREYENIVTDGLVLNLDAGYVPSYPTSGTTWYDLSGNGNNGSLINGTIFSGGSISFDGTDDNVRSTNITHSYLSSSTTEAVFKINSISDGSKYAIAGYDFNGGNYSNATTGMIYVTNQNGNKIKSAVITSTQAYREVTSTTIISLDTYYFATLIKDTVNGVLKLYVNGVLENQNTFDASTYAQWRNVGEFIGNNNFIIGSYNSYNWGLGPQLDGSVSNVKLYNRLLTDEEILQNYNAQKGRFGL